MDRITATFLGLLALATLASGQLWLRGKTLGMGQGTFLDATVTVLSAGVLVLALVGLGRILSRTAPVAATADLDRRQEEKDASR